MAIKDSRLNGINTLSYMGTNAYSPPNVKIHKRAPTSSDTKNVRVGDEWIDESTTPENIWKLVSLKGGISTWLEITTGVTPPWTVGQGGTGQITLTDHAVLVGSGTDPITPLAVATDGQILVGVTGLDPIFADLTSTGSTIDITTGAGTLDIDVSDDVAILYDTDSGTAAAALGTINFVGAGTIATSGAGSTVTITGTTPAAVATSYDGNSGTATPAVNVLTVTGGTGIDTTGAGSTMTIDASADVATSYAADSGTPAVSAANVLTISGGTNVTTSSSGSTVTINASGGGGGASTASFLAYQATDGGDPYTANPVDLGAAVAMTEVYDTGGDFTVGDGAGAAATFTAPQDGKYLIQAQCCLDGTSSIAGDPRFQLKIATSNRTYIAPFAGVIFGGSGEYLQGWFWSYQVSVIADMDTSDTLTFEIAPAAGFGVSTGQYEVLGNNGSGYYQTFVSGSLL